MGGTFDPIHNGHLVCAEEAREQFMLDEVIFIPAGRPWQKEQVSSAEDRYLMTMLATAPNDRFSVSRIEIDRGGATYTYQTLLMLREFYGPSVDLFFITGADAVREILSWKESGSVLAQANFIAATRPTYDMSKLEDPALKGKVTPMTIPALEISSSDIRRRVSEGRPIRYLLPREVAAFISERGLYKSRVEMA